MGGEENKKSAKMMQKNDSASAPNNDKSWQRTNKQKKFLKKPENKTAKKQYFKELAKNLQESIKTAEELVKDDLETFAKILEFADISKELDLIVLILLLDARRYSIKTEDDVVETFFNLARHGVLVILFQMLIVLKEKVLS